DSGTCRVRLGYVSGTSRVRTRLSFVPLFDELLVRQLFGEQRSIRVLSRVWRGSEPHVHRMRRQPLRKFSRRIRVIAAPPIVRGGADDVGADGVLLDVTEAVERVPLVADHARLVSLVPDRPEARVFLVEVSRVL